MQATLNIVTNPFHPTLGRVQKPIQRKVKINTLVNRHKIDLSKPVICYYNSEPILRKQWNKTVVKDGDTVTFIYVPQGGGGGGSNPLRTVLMIAVSIFAPQIAGTFGMGKLGTALLATGISMLGSVLVNALVPPPAPPKSQQANSMAAASPTYTIGAQGNQARLGQAIPVLYGTMKLYPDFAAQPYAEFENNEQYLYQLFCVSQGHVLIAGENIFIEDSPITSFGTDYEVEVVLPGSSPTLYPTSVYNVSEVSGQELLESPSIGPFAANPVGTTVNKLAFDIVLPRGLYYANDSGGLSNSTVTFALHATPINDVGANVGADILLGSETITANTTTAIRNTYKYDVPAGRYKVWAVRTNAKSSDSRVGNDVVWASCRGYSNVTINYGNVTMLAIKLKATNNISSQSSRKINVIAQRKLPVPTWNAGTGSYDWSAPTGTDSIAYALIDMCRSADYGAGVTEDRYDIGQLLALHTIWQSRGDTLACVFDSSQTFWEALMQAARVGRCRPYVQGGMIHFVRDAAQTLPTAMFSARNIVKDSFKITYVMPSEDTADCIDVEYFDETIWKPRIVRAALDESISKPAKIKAFGITSRDQAYREGMYVAASNRYRRKEIAFETELEGHIPSLGDLIAVQSDIPEWGQHGEVVTYTPNGANSIILCSETLTWTVGAQHYIMLRKPNGSAVGPISVSKGASDSHLVFNNATLGFTPYTEYQKERTHITFGREGQVVQLARVLSTTPHDRTVQITAINEDARVHTADGSAVPPDLYSWGIQAPATKPILTDFNIVQTGSGTTPSLSLSWLAAPGASRYIIEKSYDNANWETLGEITGTSFTLLSGVGSIYLRVAAYGGMIGPYVTKAYTVGSIPPPANVASGTISATGQSFSISWAAVTDCEGYFVEIYNAGSLKRSFNTPLTNYTYTLDNAIADGGPWRTIEVRVRARKGSVLSLTTRVLNGTNAAPAAPTLITNPGANSVGVTVSGCPDSDYAGTIIYAGDASNFAPSDANKIYEGQGTFFMHTLTGSKYYKAAHYDTYGKTGLNYSAAYEGTAGVPLGGAPDSTPPTAVTGVVVTTKMGTNTVRWTNPADNTLARVEVWRNTTNSRSTATLIASELGTAYVDTNVTPGATYYYWLRTIDFADNQGPYEPATTTTTYSIVTDGIAFSDFDGEAMLQVEIQNGEISTAHLAAGAVTAEKTKAKRHMIY